MTALLDKLTWTAEEAAEVLGYPDAAAFRRAVNRKVFPGPVDTKAKPQRWSRFALEDALRPKAARRDDGESYLDKQLGLG